MVIFVFLKLEHSILLVDPLFQEKTMDYSGIALRSDWPGEARYRSGYSWCNLTIFGLQIQSLWRSKFHSFSRNWKCFHGRAALTAPREKVGYSKAVWAKFLRSRATIGRSTWAGPFSRFKQKLGKIPERQRRNWNFFMKMRHLTLLCLWALLFLWWLRFSGRLERYLSPVEEARYRSGYSWCR